MSATSDRNLLFGILALQMDFITREQLISGMQSWVLAKDQPLAEHLERGGSLRPENRRLLEPLVAAHIKQHADDPQQSLASVSSMSSVRAELAQLADPQLDASLACVPAAAADRFDPQATLSVSVGEPSTGGARFRILRPHAEGGLGRVYVARDEELGREVALKEIKPEKDRNPDNRTRFAREAEITGGLEHPGIVPVYALGSYPDGRPYYAMRFIRGHSLKEAIEKFHRKLEDGEASPSASERNLHLRRLLQRLIDVCEAIDYAHSRGVLHRDLKPGNIMLGRYGETLVVDWGLAKAMGQAQSSELTQGGGSDNTVERTFSAESPLVPFTDGSSEPTVLGTTIGTPAFMSPEQAAARFDLLGPASDVFSLGATLYQVLTGKPPYEGPDALRQAEAGEFDRPRTIKPQIPRPLEAICLKAMATRPKERYASTRELAKDLERYLADEHVLAHEESATERLSRWSRRNRTWVRAAACALVLLAVGATAAAVMINGARQRAVAAEQQAKTNEGRAVAAATSEREAKERERVEREKAQTLAAEKAALADKMVALASEKGALADFLVGTFQANDPIGLGGVSFFIPKSDNEKLTAEEILKRGAERVRTDPALAARPVARAGVLDAIGDAYRQIGDFRAAKPLLVEALAIRKKELSPDDPDLAATCFHLGCVYHETGDYPSARPLYEEALRIRRQIPGEEGTRLTAAALRNLGWMLANEGETDTAEQNFREALALPLAPDGRANREVAFAKFGLAFTMVEQGRRVPALAMALDARREWERAEKNPQLSRAAAALVLGVVYREIPGMLAMSEAKLHESIAAVSDVLGKDYYITGLCQFELAKTLADQGQDEEAERVFQEARRICTAGDFFQHPRTILFAHEYGRFLNDRGRLPEAKEVWNEFVQGQKRRFGPAHRFVAEAQRQQARFLYDNGDAAAAKPLLEECVAICRGLDPPDEWQLGCALANLGHCRLRDGSRAWLDAEAELHEGLQLLQESKSTGRKKRLEETLFYEAEAWIALAQSLANQDKSADADRAFQSARAAAAAYPGLGDDRRHLLNQALGYHARLLRQMREVSRAADASLERKRLWRGSGSELYFVASELAQCAELVQGQSAQGLKDRCRREALAALREAVDARFKNRASIVSNPFWQALENEPDYQAILSDLGP